MDDSDLRQQITDAHRDLISMELTRAGIEEQRSAFLSDYKNVLLGLGDRPPEDWALLRAAMLHIARSETLNSEYSHWLGKEIWDSFESEAKSRLYYLTLETRDSRPVPGIDYTELFPRHRMTDREATFYYSRAALAILVSSYDPNQAIDLFEDLKPICLPPILYLLPTGEHYVPFDRELGRLPVLYERVGRFEDALDFSPIEFHSYGNGASACDVAIRRLDGWLNQLCQSGGISEVERCLDMLYAWLEQARDVDEEERDNLEYCSNKTRQYWAWFYGNALGRLLAARPSLHASLLGEIEAGEWERCWHIAGVLFEIPPQSWDEYRRRAVKFYNASDIEDHQNGPVPWDATRPPHLSAQSDLYWAMRIGFADAQPSSSTAQPTAESEIADSLKEIKTIASSTAQHVLRTEHITEQLQEDVRSRVMPNDEHWYGLLRERLPFSLKVLPVPTVQHLADALRSQFGKEWDECALYLCKAVESLFHQVLETELRDLPGAPGLKLVIPRPRNSPRSYSIEQWNRIQLSGWSRIIESTTEGGANAEFRSLLPTAFPNIDLEALVQLHADLARIAQLRGSSAHDSSTSDQRRAENASELWALVVGSRGDGFLNRFLSALGESPETIASPSQEPG